MPAEPTGAKRLRDLTADFQDGVGQRLRSERERRGLSLRELARRLAISPSALSQIETGRSRPSVGTLYAIVTELGISLDELFGSPRAAAAAAPESGAAGVSGASLVQRRDSRKQLDLESGVRWERLTPTAEPDADFLLVRYEVGGASSREGTHMRHMGREYGVVLSGRLRVTIGFDEEEYELGPGDSIAFESSRPHRLENAGDEPVEAIWFVAGRSLSDVRKRALDGESVAGLA
ncbi:MAG TPA: XRE family transcriptional regulator [Solirubrobacteraceae bacterium]|jgi:transcriptional regulator with XRE-family HTH domain